MTKSDRLRRIGVAILVIGLAAAAVYYMVESRAVTRTPDELLTNAQRDTDREIGLMMGTFGVIMLGWSRALEQTGTQAILIAAGSAFAAFICYRVAHVWEHNDRVRSESAMSRKTEDRA